MRVFKITNMKHKKIVIIVVVAVVLVILYFVMKNNAPATAPTPSTGTANPPAPNEPGSAQPPAVSQPAPISQQPANPLITPVVIASPVATFNAGTTDAQTQGAAGSAAQAYTASGNLPSGFQTWYNSLGPNNKAYVAGLIPTMTAAEIALVDNIVTNNLWGDTSVAAGWNAFVGKYGLPLNNTFSNFTGSKKRR